MTEVTPKQLIRALEARGWVLLRTAGSHRIYGKDDTDVRLSIPVHGNKSLKLGLARHLMKLAGIQQSDL